MRKSPVRHKVRSHTREGKRVSSFLRGKGQKKSKVRKIQKKVGGSKILLMNREVKVHSLIDRFNIATSISNKKLLIKETRNISEEVADEMEFALEHDGVVCHRIEGPFFGHDKIPIKKSQQKKTKIKMLEGFSAGRSVPVSKDDILEVIRFTESGDAIVWVGKMPSVWREMTYKTKPAKRMRVQIPSYMFEEETK